MRFVSTVTSHTGLGEGVIIPDHAQNPRDGVGMSDLCPGGGELSPFRTSGPRDPSRQSRCVRLWRNVQGQEST